MDFGVKEIMILIMKLNSLVSKEGNVTKLSDENEKQHNSVTKKTLITLLGLMAIIL